MELKRNDLPKKEKRHCILTFIVEDGIDTGYSGELTGAQINAIERVLARNLHD